MKVKATINAQFQKEFKKIAQDSLVETTDVLRTNLKRSKTIPRDAGALQNRSSYIDESKKKKSIVILGYDTPYARRLYYHPEYKFRKDKNPNAGALWFEPYISGDKKDFATKAFAKILRGKLK